MGSGRRSPTNLIAESKSLYNNSEHFSFNLPTTAQYLFRVHWTSELFDLVGDANSEHYGLAWSVAVPEPGTLSFDDHVLAASASTTPTSCDLDATVCRKGTGTATAKC